MFLNCIATVEVLIQIQDVGCFCTPMWMGNKIQSFLSGNVCEHKTSDQLSNSLRRVYGFTFYARLQLKVAKMLLLALICLFVRPCVQM